MELCVNFNASKNVCCEISGGNVTLSISLLGIFKLESGFPKCKILTNSMQLLHLCHHTFRLYQWIEESSQANIQSLALYHHFSSSKPVLPTFDPILPTFSSFLAIFRHFWPILALFGPFFTLRRPPSTDFVYIYINKNLSIQEMPFIQWINQIMDSRVAVKQRL